MALKRSSAEVLESSTFSMANSRSQAATRALSSGVPSIACRRARTRAWSAAFIRASSRAKRLDALGVFAGPRAEHRRAGNQHVGPGLDAAPGRFGIDAAIDLEMDRLAQRVDRAAQGRDLGELALDERLAAEARIDAHHQHEVEVA